MAQAGKADIAFDFGCGAWDNDGIQNLSRGDEGTGTSSARKTLQWSVFSEMGPAGPKNREQEWRLARGL